MSHEAAGFMRLLTPCGAPPWRGDAITSTFDL